MESCFDAENNHPLWVGQKKDSILQSLVPSNRSQRLRMSDPASLSMTFWGFGLLSTVLFLWILQSVVKRVHQGPAFCFLAYWAGHLLFSFFGFALYFWFTSLEGRPFARYPDTTATLLLVFSLGFVSAWWTLFPLLGKGSWTCKSFRAPDVWKLWLLFAGLAMAFFLAAGQTGWFRVRWETGNFFVPGSPLYWLGGSLAVMAPTLYLSMLILSQSQSKAKRAWAGLFLLLAVLLFLRTGGRGYLMGLILVLFFAACEKPGSLQTWLRPASFLFAAGVLLFLAAYFLRELPVSAGHLLGRPLKEGLTRLERIQIPEKAFLMKGIIYRLAAADPQTVIDLQAERQGPKLGFKNFGRLRHLFLPKIFVPEKRPLDDGPERMKGHGYPLDKFSSYPIGFLADLWERFRWFGVFLASWLCGLALLVTGFCLYRLFPAPLPGLLLSPMIFALPVLPETSLLGFINRITYQNLRDFLIVGCIAGLAAIALSMRGWRSFRSI